MPAPFLKIVRLQEPSTMGLDQVVDHSLTAGAAVAGAFGAWYNGRKAKSAQKKAAAQQAARSAEYDLKRRRVPGDPQLGQRAEYSLTNATNFKTPASIVLGKSEDAPVLKDWLESLIQSSKFNVQFACDWKSDVNKRTISWHCFRHNMSSSNRSYGMDGNNVNMTDNTSLVTAQQQAVAGYIGNASWPQWMDPIDPAITYDWVGEASSNPATNGVYTQLAYRNFMLRPDNLTTISGSNIQNSKTAADTDINGGYTAKQNVTHPFIEQLHNRIYYAPVNISDLEDESFLNNRIINSGQFNALSGTPLATSSLLTNAHRSVSKIGQQNVKYAVTPAMPYVAIIPPSVGAGIPADGASRNQYKGLIKKGNINYKFINKADGPGKVEIIVWKFKSTHVSPPCYANLNTTGQTSSTTDSRYYMQFAEGTGPVPPSTSPSYAGTPAPVCNAIQTTLDRYSEAYFKAVTSKYASDDMSGRVPLKEDLYDNPNFPLFKKYSKYFQESLCDFTEHSRYTYNLQSGQRQEVNIKLPGEHYNPINVGKDFSLNQGQSHSRPDAIPIRNLVGYPGIGSTYGENPINPFNKFTYFVMVATSGCNMAATFEKGVDGNYYADPAGTTLQKPFGPDQIDVGTAWSSSHIQAYCTYSESIGAMSCKLGQRSLYNLGGLQEPVPAITTGGGATGAPAPVYQLSIGPKIPMDRIIRVPPQVTVNRISLGDTANGAYPTDSSSTSGDKAYSNQHKMPR